MVVLPACLTTAGGRFVSNSGSERHFSVTYYQTVLLFIYKYIENKLE